MITEILKRFVNDSPKVKQGWSYLLLYQTLLFGLGGDVLSKCSIFTPFYILEFPKDDASFGTAS